MNTALKDFIEVIETGKREKGGSINEGIPSIGAEHLQSDGHINWSEASMRYISSAFFDTMKSGKLRINDVLLVKDGATTGKVAYVDDIPSGNAAINEHVFLIRPQKELLSKYLFFYLYSPVGTSKILHFFHGAAIGGISRDFLNAEIKVPSLSEQEKVIRQLSGIESIIKSCKQLFAKLDTLVKSRFIEMFGDPVTNPMGWERITLGDAIQVKPQNGLYKPQFDYVNDNSGTPILRIDAFYDGKVKSFSDLKRLNCTPDEIEFYLLKEGDIVINRVNSLEYLGKCAHITGLLEDTVFESNMMRFHMQDVFNPVYVTYLLCSQYIKNQIMNCAKKAVNQASINQKDVQGFIILKPPIDLQNQFAAFVQQVDKSKLVIQKLLEKQEILRAALMQEYFG